MAINGLTSAGAGGRIQSAIAHASQKTGVDFSYLLGQAQVESSLRPDAKAATSSATGLYQFIDQSWLAVMKKHGGEHGLGWAADSIHQGSNGRLSVADGATRDAILKLRTDSDVASLMAAEHAADNKTALESTLGRPAGAADLYMAHFLGLGGAQKFLSKMATDPGASGAAMFPAAAGSNRSIFYAQGGRARSLAEIYDRFADKIERGAQIAGAGKALPPLADRPATGLAATDDRMGDAIDDVSTLERMMAATGEQSPLLRPGPDNARLAYLMLATLGAR